MGLFDDLGDALKKMSGDLKKADPGREGTENSGTGSKTPDKTRIMKSGRSPHPGYQKIAAWMRRKYRDRLAGSAHSTQKSLELELLTTEAGAGLSDRVRKGFLEYLKQQDYEPLLK